MSVIIPKNLNKYSNQPWMMWLIICLCRQESRQHWLKEVHEKMKDTVVERTGVVPNLPDWEYHYHGIGLCLNGPNNETIDVDFHDGTASMIDPYFFAHRVIGLIQGHGPESRLRFWLSDAELIVMAIRDLQGGVLEPDDSHIFKLNENFRSDWDCIKQSDFSNLDSYNKWLEQIEGVDSDENQAFESWLLEKLNNEKLSAFEFGAIIKALPDEIQLLVCSGYLEGEINAKMAMVVKTLSTRNDAPEEKVVKVLDKLNPERHHPFIAHTICSFLLDRGLEKEKCLSTIKKFSDQRVVAGYGGNPYDYDLALLALIHSPQLGLSLLQRTLRSSTPAAVQSISALLSLIDEDWSNDELLKAVSGEDPEDKPDNLRYIAAALLHSKNKGMNKLGYEIMPKPIKRDSDQFGYTHDEVMEANLDNFFSYALEGAKKDVSRLNLEEIRAIVLGDI